MARNSHSTAHVRKGRHHTAYTTTTPCQKCGRNVPASQAALNIKAGLPASLCREHSDARTVLQMRALRPANQTPPNPN